MFPTHSPYSQFFTSGLFNRSIQPDVPLSPRRGSLPTDPRDAPEDVSAFYFTLQPRRDEEHLRSFLSLDLAESQSMRSASLKRKASSATKSFRFPRISEVSPPPAPLRMRFSRDSLRTIPSPKPAPSITLPELPKIPSTPPRLPSIQLTPSLDLFPAIPTTFASPPRPIPRLRIDLAPAIRRISVATHATSSTVSTRARTHNRSEALARLEGRVRRPATAPLPKRNFMSMSDDDDSDTDSDAADADDDLSDLDSLDFPEIDLVDPRMEPEDVVLPLPSPPIYLEAPRSAPLPPRPSHRASAKRALTQNDGPLRRQRTRTGKPPASAGPAAEWFPLKSFIDLHNEPAADTASAREEGLRRVYGAAPKRDSQKTKSASSRSSGGGAGWVWRSFIEVANVA